MIQLTYRELKGNLEFEKTLEAIIDFVSAKYSNSERYARISEFGKEAILTNPNMVRFRAYSDPQWISTLLFMQFALREYSLESINPDMTLACFSLLERKGVIYKDYLYQNAKKSAHTEEYSLNDGLIESLTKTNHFKDYLLGFQFIIDKYSNSVVKLRLSRMDLFH